MKKMKTIIAGALAFVWSGYAADQLLAADPLSRLANSAETQKFEAMVTPSQPYVLPDGRTRILVEKQAEHGFVPGIDDEARKPGSRVQVTNDDRSVDLTLQSLNFDRKAELVEVAVKTSASSKVSEAEAVILEYGNPAAALEPWKPAYWRR